MSKVYLAVHQDVPNLKVILKILDDPRMGERFKQEADKLALLDGHPNICRIKHFFNHGDNTVIAMEYIDGITLEDKIKQEGTIPVEEALRVTNKVLDILGFAHRKDVYHRDIKPGNIMIDKRGQVKIIDFGIAKGKTDPNLTIAGTACGTPVYMAPEQFNPSENTDYALIDVYATGTTLFLMLTGEVPFKGDNPFVIRDAKLTSDPPSPRSINSNIPKTLEKIILKSLARNPEDRYRSANEMRAALVAFSPDVEKDIQSITTNVDINISDVPTTKSIKPAFIAIGIVALIVVTSGLYWLLASDAEDANLETSNITVDTVSQSVDSVETPVIVPTGTISITAQPKGDIYVGDSLLGKMIKNAEVILDTGIYIVRVVNSRATTKQFSDTIQLSPDVVIPLDYQFNFPVEPTKPKPKPKIILGEVRIGSNPQGADVYIDGSKQDDPTNNTYILKPGQHTIMVSLVLHGEVVTKDTTIIVKGDQVHKVKFEFEN